jgi:nicotinate-nucleotide adenylyltransferase
MRVKFGICGGTFDPIHMGHLLIAETAREQLGLDKVLFMPNGNPPHKRDAVIAPATHRMEMVRLAVADNPYFIPDEREIRAGTSYTVDTLTQLKHENPGEGFVYIIGGDTLPELPTWRRFSELFRLCRFAVYPREGFNREDIEEDAKRLHDRYGLEYDLLAGPRLDLSSTDLRERIERGASLRYLLPDSIVRYIEKYGLYTGNGA